MKKKVILPLFLAAAVLASCGNGDVSSSGSEGGDSSSSGSISQGSGSESQGGGETDDKEDLGAIMALIDEAKAGSNYSYGLYDGETVSGKIVLTKDYIYDTTSDSASIALDSYEGEGKFLYSLVHGSEGYEVRNALTYEDSTGKARPYAATSELDYLRLLEVEGVDWSEDAFFYQSGSYLSEDEDIIAIFANMFGLSTQVPGIFRVALSLVDGDSVKVSFAPSFTEGSDIELIDGTVGIIEEVGTSSESKMEDFLLSWSLPEEHLTEGMLSPVAGNLVSYEANVSVYLDDVIYDVPSDILATYDIAGEERSITDRRGEVPVESRYQADGEGMLEEVYLGPDNLLHHVSSTESYASSVPDFLSLLEGKAFRKTGTNEYRYFGYRYDEIATKIGGSEIGMGVVIEMTASLDEEGKLAHIEAISRDVQIGDGIFHYEMSIDFLEGEPLAEVAPYKDGSDDESIGLAFEDLDETGGYKLVATKKDDESFPRAVTVADDIVLYDIASTDTAPGGDYGIIHTYSGYVFANDKVSPFVVDDTEDGLVARLTDEGVGALSLADYLPVKGIDPRALAFDGTGEHIVPKAGIKGFKDHLFLGPNGQYIVDSTLSFDYRDGKVQGYTYGTDGFGEEKVEITYGATLPSDIDFSAIRGSFERPTTWSKGEPDVYEKLVGIEWVGEEWADKIPYLYDSYLSGWWDLSDTDPLVSFEIFNDRDLVGSEKSQEYAEAYKALLVEEGFVYGDISKSWGKAGYGIHIEILYSESSMFSLRIWNESMWHWRSSTENIE